MNKEIKDHINSLSDDEKYSYGQSIYVIERIFDILGVFLIILALLIPGILIVIVSIGVVCVLGFLAGALKETRLYIDEKLDLD